MIMIFFFFGIRRFDISLVAFDSSKSKYQQTSLPESLTDLESNNGDTIITLGFELGCGPTKKDKTEQNLRRKQSLSNDNSMGKFAFSMATIVLRLFNLINYCYPRNNVISYWTSPFGRCICKTHCILRRSGHVGGRGRLPRLVDEILRVRGGDDRGEQGVAQGEVHISESIERRTTDVPG